MGERVEMVNQMGISTKKAEAKGRRPSYIRSLARDKNPLEEDNGM